jgi:S1-C subfamily serine protease
VAGGTAVARRLAFAALLVVATAADANPPPVPPTVRRALAAATVLVLPSRCAGAVVESPWLVVTAKHCIDADEQLRVRVAGVEHDAVLIDGDGFADQVVLALDAPAPVEPLGLVRRLPIVGTVLYFRGNPDRPRWQAARIEKYGTCPTLPALTRALYTSIDGRPGDSGSPLVDLLGRVVGIVHGGSQCRIATPADRLALLVDRVLERTHASALASRLIGTGRSASPTS